MILLKINFPIMRALNFITGHVIYDPAYTYKFRLKTTIDKKVSAKFLEMILGMDFLIDRHISSFCSDHTEAML